MLPKRVRETLSRIWIYTLISSAVFLLIALEISVFGFVPGITNPDTIFTIIWILLFSSLFLINLSFVSGFAHDIERQKN